MVRKKDIYNLSILEKALNKKYLGSSSKRIVIPIENIERFRLAGSGLVWRMTIYYYSDNHQPKKLKRMCLWLVRPRLKCDYVKENNEVLFLEMRF